ncbi:hypothetical protein [Streptomyces lomondensis]|uniref:Uncharacterized protein n=1 Tax=Streptomyces lomondensis TaxID=68229 RepID=A0ABQ2XPG9_9ACTN|nr:hypothetical protein [Streptomyces lomondensis]MCF0082173.1 hypothetical protein [Streptomyces lomondensis]GGX27843.1 hypothetical protein GCM10010383_68170 [Streptomyces lomondensis]
MEATAGAHIRFKNRATGLYTDGMNLGTESTSGSLPHAHLDDHGRRPTGVVVPPSLVTASLGFFRDI